LQFAENAGRPCLVTREIYSRWLDAPHTLWSFKQGLGLPLPNQRLLLFRNVQTLSSAWPDALHFTSSVCWPLARTGAGTWLDLPEVPER
jgi:hypothetical protein